MEVGYSCTEIEFDQRDLLNPLIPYIRIFKKVLTQTSFCFTLNLNSMNLHLTRTGEGN